LVSGIQTGFFNDFLAIAIYPMLITKSLKRPYFVTAYNGDFVQCVSPMVVEFSLIARLHEGASAIASWFLLVRLERNSLPQPEFVGFLHFSV
jgi:hypothetical protein